MKKKLLAIFSALALTVGVSALTACELDASSSVPDSTASSSSTVEPAETLNAPVITLNADKTVSWTAVEGATGYVVAVNGVNQPAQTGTSFAAKTETGDYTVKVKAVSSETESEYSTEVSYSLYAVTMPTATGYVVTGEDSVYSGDSYSFTVTLDEAYNQSTPFVEVNGERVTAVEGVYTVANASQDLEITVSSVKLNTYTVTLPESTDKIQISGKTEVTHGESTSIFVMLADGYDRSQITVKANGEALTAVEGVYKLENITGNVVLSVEGVALNSYTVALPTGTGYTVEGNTSVSHGGNYSFSLKLAQNYEAVDAVVKCGETVLTAVDGVYTVQNVTGDITITVEGVAIKKATYTIKKYYDDKETVTETARADYNTEAEYTVADFAERFYKIDETQSKLTGVVSDSLVLEVYYKSTVDLNDPSTWFADERSTITYADGVYTFTHDNAISLWHDIYVSKKVVNAWLEAKAQSVQVTLGTAGLKFESGGSITPNARTFTLALEKDTDSVITFRFPAGTNENNTSFSATVSVIEEFDENDVTTWLYFNRVGNQYVSFADGVWTLAIPDEMRTGTNNFQVVFTDDAYEYLTNASAEMSYEILLADGAAHFSGTDFNTYGDGWFNGKPLAKIMAFYIGASSLTFRVKANIYNSNDISTWLSLGVGTMSNPTASSATITASSTNNLTISKKKVNEWLDAGATKIAVAVSGSNVSGHTTSMPNSSSHPYAETTWAGTANQGYCLGWINISESNRDTDVVASVYTNQAIDYNVSIQGMGATAETAVLNAKGVTTYNSETGVYTVSSFMTGYSCMYVSGAYLSKLFADGYTKAKITAKVIDGGLDAANSTATTLTGATGMTITVDLSANTADLLLNGFYYSGSTGYTIKIEGVTA